MPAGVGGADQELSRRRAQPGAKEEAGGRRPGGAGGAPETQPGGFSRGADGAPEKPRQAGS